MSTIVNNTQIFSQTNVTTSYTYNIDVTNIDNIAISVTCTPVSSGTGTLVLNASVDGANFAPIPNSSTSISASGTTIYTVANPAYKYIQVSYTASSNGMTIVGSINSRDNTIVSN
jgi:hypothetical protein